MNMNSYNPNRLKIQDKDFHCICVASTMENTVSYQGGMYTVIDMDHPLKRAIDASWGDFLVVYENCLYYAITSALGEDGSGEDIVRLYNITDDTGDLKKEPDETTPGWIIMDIKDISVSIEDNTFIRWRYDNSGKNKTMDFRINQVKFLPHIGSHIVGQIFWSTEKSKEVQIAPDEAPVSYEPGVYLCEDTRYVRLDFDENDPSFLKYQVKDMAIQGDPGNRYLYLYSYYYEDPVTGELLEATENNDLNTICKVDAEDWYRHIDVSKSDPSETDVTSEYIPSNINDMYIVDSITRDDYGHVTKYNIMTNVNLRYRWEEI